MGARKFPCLTCNVAFRFQGHLDRHYRLGFIFLCAYYAYRMRFNTVKT